MVKVLPSTNPISENKLVDYVKNFSDLGVEYVHCDVMDGKFVENKCLSYELIRDIRNNVNILLDIHLMTEDVYKNVKKYAELKPSIITFHYEAFKSYREFLNIVKYLRKRDIMVGLSIKPTTPIEIIERYLDFIDLVLVMSVEPGKSGQEFMESTYKRLETLNKMINKKNILVEVDGGINESNYDKLKKMGVDFIVMGKAFYEATDKKQLLVSVDNHYN